MRKIKPKILKPGATIGVFTPSAPVDRENFEKGIDFLKQSGFKLKLGANALKVTGYLAGTDEERVSDLHSLFLDPAIDAIFCSSGGYNSNRLLDKIDYKLIAQNPKIFMGLSDPTSLLCAIYTKSGLITFHGPVVQFDMSWNYTSYTERYLEKALSMVDAIGYIVEVTGENVLKPGKASGRLVGGNLTSIQYLLGTPYEPDWRGALLFWEDVFEEPHVLDAKLVHLRSAGVFDQINGMVIGQLVGCEEEEFANTPSIEETVLDLCKDYNFPILYDVLLGHTKDKLTIPIGVEAEIDTQGMVLSIVESGVR